MFKHTENHIYIEKDKTQKKSLQTFILYVLVLCVFLIFNYNPQSYFEPQSRTGWIYALIATIGIIVLMQNIDVENWKKVLGISFKKKFFKTFFIFFLIILIVIYLYLRTLASSNGYIYSPSLFTYFTEIMKGNNELKWMNIIPLYLYHVPQTFNEEMITGGLLLFYSQRLIRNKLQLASVIALVFSGGHFIFYLITPAQTGQLTLITLGSLFFVGFIRNFLILVHKNIGFAWILHLSWNILFFPSYYYIRYTRFVLEGETNRINLILGDWRTMSLAFLVSLSLVFTHYRKKRS
jgi:hypothetical protein